MSTTDTTVLFLNADASNEQPLDDMPTITRVDIRKDEIRLFAGKAVQTRLPIPDGAKVDTIEGILAAMDFTTPMSEADVKSHLEAALEAAAQRRGSVIPDSYRYSYGEDQNCGDDVAAELKAYCGGGLKDPLDLAKVEEVANANGIGDRFDVWMAKGLNPGMVRMNTGNVLRGMARNEKPIRIGAKVWNVAAPEAEQPAA